MLTPHDDTALIQVRTKKREIAIRNLSKAREKRDLVRKNTTSRAKNPEERLQATKYPTTSIKFYRLAVACNCFECNERENYMLRTRECLISKCPFYEVRPWK